MLEFIAIYFYDYMDKWYWILHRSGGPLKISPYDNTSKDLCLERIRILQDDGSLPICKVAMGGFREPPNYKERSICDP